MCCFLAKSREIEKPLWGYPQFNGAWVHSLFPHNAISQPAHLACRASQNVYFRTLRHFPECRVDSMLVNSKLGSESISCPSAEETCGVHTHGTVSTYDKEKKSSS